MPKFSDKTFDTIKWIALIVLPASGTAYFGLASQFGLPGAPQVAGAVTIAVTFLGTILGFSTKQYNSDLKTLEAAGFGPPTDGVVELETDPGGIKRANLILEGDPETLLMNNDVITFRVKKPAA